jgi:hypothetical protein
MIKAIHEVTLDEISRQIQRAPYVAVMSDEAFDIQMDSQLTTVLRFIYDGKIRARLFGFTYGSSDGLFSHVQSAVSELNLKSKLVAQIHDGASFIIRTVEWSSA